MGETERQSPVRSGARLHQEFGPLGRFGAARIDDDQLGAAILRLVDQRHLMDIRLGRVLSPEDDQPRVDEIPRRIVPIVAHGETGRLQTGRPAEISIDRRIPTVQTPESWAGGVQ